MYPELTDKQLQRVADVIKAFFKLTQAGGAIYDL
jgi:hypothetical protein